ncbi:MAG: HlyC/CorC family transporter [Firmicutes bacterium]|nr:HlyC/CorC family transporter [Bacillota bacterium]MBQ9015625.1 HlyC/CorC family transporter [Bacillota bacterium]MBQ9059948.1 HlyC/CorC family transporter [Bacillota bacterium]
MNGLPGQLVLIAILILFSAYFSATETAFTSVNRIRMKNLASDGNRKAEKVLALSEKYDKLLTTILIGNNVVNIWMTAIATSLCIWLYGAHGATIATIAITVIVLIFGEITPKNIAKEKSEGFSMVSAPFIGALMTILTPITFIFTKWKQFIGKIFKLGQQETITDDEILTMVEEAETEGSIDEGRSELIQNAIEFDELTAEDVMTPRPDMVAIDTDCTQEELADLFRETGYSRLPVYEEEIDRIIGVINQKDFHNQIVGTDKKIIDCIIPVVFVAETIKIFDLLRKMQQLKTHMAIVIDEYGGTEGLVTMEDIIEELVGEIYDEHDVVINKEILPLQNGSYRVQASASVARIFDYLDIDEEIQEVNTINGWVAMNLDRLPKRDDKFETTIGDKLLKVRVTKADDRKAIEINLVCETIADEEETEEKDR